MIIKSYLPAGIPQAEGNEPCPPCWLYDMQRRCSDGKEYSVAVYYLEDTPENEKDFLDTARKAFAKRERYITGTL